MYKAYQRCLHIQGEWWVIMTPYRIKTGMLVTWLAPEQELIFLVEQVFLWLGRSG